MPIARCASGKPGAGVCDPLQGFRQFRFRRGVGDAEIGGEAEGGAGDDGDVGVFEEIVREVAVGFDALALRRHLQPQALQLRVPENLILHSRQGVINEPHSEFDIWHTGLAYQVARR